MSKFFLGERVRKIVGYPFVGKVVAVYPSEEKCSVRHADGWDHIFHDKQLAYDHPEYQYLDLLNDVLVNGNKREGRNGATRSVFGRQIRFDLTEGFPLLTTKKMHWKSIAHELIWFISGDTNTRYLKDNGVTIWDEWEDENGDLGPVYGKQWRSWDAGISYRGGASVHSWIDQLATVVEQIKEDPYSRRHIVSAWNVADLDKMALPPCHCLFQFHVADGKLSCQLYQRSADIFLGVPFNIASYALLTLMVANEVGLKPGEFVHSFGDLHLYENHVEQAQEQLTRTPLPLPYITMPTNKKLFDIGFEDIILHHYQSHPAIKAPVSK